MNKLFDGYTVLCVPGPKSIHREFSILCYRGFSQVAELKFKDGADVGPNQYSNGIIYLYYDIKCFKDVLKLLQYEKPLYVHYDNSNDLGFIVTGSYEPVGEQEN